MRLKKFKNNLNLLKISDGMLADILDDVRVRGRLETDISDHLETLFLEAVSMAPRLIVELGAGDGESTFAFERVAKLWKAVMVSVDIEDRHEVGSYSRRHFIHQDDITFAAEFPAWCRDHGLEAMIDILFIDTSHLYEHTVQEIAVWFPYLSRRGKIIFHDTNMGETFVRKDGTTGKGWDNDRGVIRAVEEYFNKSFNEKEDFTLLIDGWLIRHVRHCNGLTILERYGQ